MAKPKARRVPSDDCQVTIGGETYTPHEGEWVELLEGQTVAEISAAREFLDLQSKFDALQGEDDENRKVTALLDNAFTRLCSALAQRITAWSWTDDAGRPLPPPDGSPEPIKNLRTEEVYYLLSCSKGEPPAERKNG